MRLAHLFALFIMGMVGFVIHHGDGAAAIDNAFAKIFDRRSVCRRLSPQHRSQLFRLVIPIALPLVELLHIS